MRDKYWGIYCSQHGVWFRKPDGELYFYPSESIAQAHINTEIAVGSFYPTHLWQTQEFGQEIVVDLTSSPDITLCPIGRERAVAA